MKILVVNDILQGGGVEKLMYDFVTYFCDKYEITILTDVMDSDFTIKVHQNDKLSDRAIILLLSAFVSDQVYENKS